MALASKVAPGGLALEELASCSVSHCVLDNIQSSKLPYIWRAVVCRRWMQPYVDVVHALEDEAKPVRRVVPDLHSVRALIARKRTCALMIPSPMICARSGLLKT